MLSIVGIAPHPPIIIPEIGRGRLEEARSTVDGMKELCRKVKNSQPELVVVITPHGRVVRSGPAILAAEQLSGNFGQFGFPSLSIEMKSDQDLIDLLVQEASSSSLKPVLLGEKENDNERGINLDHGAMVPLYYLQEAGLFLPGLHLSISFDSYKELYQFGQDVKKAIDKRGVPTAVIASGDLSHRLKPGAPAGYSPKGKEFDQQLVSLIKEKKVDDLLNLDQHLVEEAGECGLRPIVIALGMLSESGFTPEIISYEGPFGVGYLVSALYPQQSG